MIGFTFKGVHSSAYNIGVKSLDRSFLPDLRSNEVTIPGIHGTIDFGKNTYGKREINLEIGLIKNNWQALRQNARNIAGWLSGKGRLIFDDEPDKAYQASIYESVSITQIQSLPAGLINITFDCQPFAEDVEIKQSVNDISASPTTISIESAGTVKTPCKIYIKNTGTNNITTINLIRKVAK